LNAQGIPTAWADARHVLRAETRPGATQKASLLSATCDFTPDSDLQARWRALDQVVITQGFIAANDCRRDVCCWAAADRTRRVRILRPNCRRRAWRFGPTCPACSSANPRAVADGEAAARLALRRGSGNCQQWRQGLHPRCILAGPAIQDSIARICHAGAGTRGHDRVRECCRQRPHRSKRLRSKRGITLVSMESPGMWHQVGFLAGRIPDLQAEGYR